MIEARKKQIGDATFTVVQLDCTLILPEGWEVVVHYMGVNTETRTITPMTSDAVFEVRRKPE